MHFKAAFGYLLFITTVAEYTTATTPIVLWHGMGDTCCFPFSLGSIKKILQEKIEGVYVKSLKIGGNLIEDYKSGFFIHPDKQLKDACNQISTDPQLTNGFNALGFSQGAQFLRALAQRCPNPPMKTLVSFGGQHQGVFGLPECPSLSKQSCEYMRKVLNYAAYEKWVQKLLVQATYWHDPLNEAEYKAKSTFLADINNERTVNQTYIDNLQKLERFVMVKFLNDTIVQPIETEWFGFYKPDQDKDILPLKESPLYKEDRLGLRQLDADSKLVFLAIEGDHLHFTDEWLDEHIVPILKN
ncbi:unnamed protein product [Hermetia illucens]|uniref:Palmitoyl-protein thioesterase 1 n=1 Tax=Hermetia illucens TaxID=343691 RepID=A0A7R8V241_HERIL|nr:palmitoyl-protein thioesterase 1 [Hermetia illucens]CAD7090235.1 unnamed protein product [Hermetia illucens]